MAQSLAQAVWRQTCFLAHHRDRLSRELRQGLLQSRFCEACTMSSHALFIPEWSTISLVRTGSSNAMPCRVINLDV